MSNRFFAKKSLGQTFLVDEQVINKIINCANLSKNDNVIEIGPGFGALTVLISNKVKSLVTYEIDPKLIPILKSKIHSKNTIIKNEDFLASKLKWSIPKKLVANIPYFITSDILFKVFNNKQLFQSAILMVQEEVANRIIAPPNSSNYNKLSVVSQYFANIEKLFVVSSSSFRPKPKVDSAIIKLTFKKSIMSNNDEKKFLEFVKTCFRMRRKTLINNFKKSEQVKLKKFFEGNNYSQKARAQELSVNDFIKLYILMK